MPTWYSGWAPEWLKPVFRPITPDHISTEELVNQLERGAEAARRVQRLDDADQGADRHADDRHPHAGRAQDLGRRPRRRSRRSARRSRPLLPSVRGHAQRVRGAHGRRVLPRHRVEPRRAGALRPEHRRGADRRAERDRRRERHDDGRGARALPGERPLHARFPLRPRRARPRARAGLGRRAPDPARPAGHDQGRHRAGHDPQRGRPADRLRLRGRRRPRPRAATSRRRTG